MNSFFIGANIRSHIREGLGDYTPIMLIDISHLFDSGQIPLDAVLIMVTPPDVHGKVSLGVSVDVVKSAADNGSLVIAQVNPRLPRTMGYSFLDVADLDGLVPAERELLEIPSPEPTEVTRQIGESIAGLVEDGSTVEFGIGRIPHAVVELLKNKRDLGIHTEMLTDSIIDLVESGAVTGARKRLDRGLILASFCMGSQRLYDYVRDNPRFSFRPTEYVNDPSVIAKQHKMVAINTALEIDLTGQVCADSLDGRYYSSIGGQVDFNRGAARSPGGKPIIALPSTAQDGAVSRIVTRLSPGGGGGHDTRRGALHRHRVRRGLPARQEHPGAGTGADLDRAPEVPGPAHPRSDRGAVPAAGTGAGRGEVCRRRPADARRLRARGRHPGHDLLPFHDAGTAFHSPGILNYVYIDHRKDVAIVGTVPEAHGEEIVAVGRYYLDEKSNRAEVAFTVRDEWQGRGIGHALFAHLVTIARRAGIAGFSAEVLRENRRMQAIFNHSGLKVRSRLLDDVVSFEMEFD